MGERRNVRGLTALLAAAACLAALLAQQYTAVSDQRPVAYSPPSVSPFVDVPGTSTSSPHTFYREIAWLSDQKISTGYVTPQGRVFEPQAPILREQMAAFLYRLAGEPAVDLPATSPFADLPASHPFYTEVVWLRSTGVTTGYTESDERSTFRGSQPVLREQMAAFLFRFKTWQDQGTAPPSSTTGPRPFIDVPGGHAFQREIRWLASTGVSTGYAESGAMTFRPTAPVLREQMAAFLFRYSGLGDVVAPTTPTTPTPTPTVPIPTTPAPTATPPVVAAPTVTHLSSTSGSVAGGYAITVHGSHLTGATAVTFGEVASPQFYVSSPTTAIVSVPAGAATGSVDVRVTTPGGRSEEGVPFEYVPELPADSPPTIASLNRATGDVLGGYTLWIQGTKFVDVTSVTIGGVEATILEVESAQSLKVVVPPAADPGPVPVVVTAATGSSASATFTYHETSRPEPVSLSPAEGDVSGQTRVRIVGTRLGGQLLYPTKVMFGDQQGTIVDAQFGTELTVLAPATTAPGPVPVVVWNAYGASTAPLTFDYKPDGFLPTITSTSPPAGVALAPYDYPLTTADGRSGTWQVTEGELPPGVTLTGDRLTGTTLRTGVYGVTVTFVDESGRSRSVDLVIGVALPAWIDGIVAGESTVVDRDPGDVPGRHYSGSAVISADGRFVAYVSSRQAVPGNSSYGLISNAYVLDTETGVTELVSGDPDGSPATGASVPAISADGRYVAFSSTAANLVPGDTNGVKDVFVRDRSTGTTERVSVTSTGQQVALGVGDGGPRISDDGRFVVFGSEAPDLVDGFDLRNHNVYRHDRETGRTELVSVPQGPNDIQTFSGSSGYSLSGDGRHVGYAISTTYVYGHPSQVWVRDMETGATDRVSTGERGLPGNDASGGVALSVDGRFVVFTSLATNLVRGDTNGVADVFVKDRATGQTRLASVSVSGGPVDASSGGALDISDDGRYVSFTSSARNLVRSGGALGPHAFVHDTASGLTERLTVVADQVPVYGTVTVAGHGFLSGDGRFVAMTYDWPQAQPPTSFETSTVLLDRRPGTP